MCNSYEEEKYDTTLDILLDYVRNLPESSVKLLNIDRYQIILKAAAQLTDLLKSSYSEGELNIEIDQVFNTGCITVELDNLVVYNPIAFGELIKTADNFEIYPLVDGKIRMDISYHSVLRTIA